MRQLLTLTIPVVLAISVKVNFESEVWKLVDAVYPKLKHLRKCESNIEINLAFKRLIINNNVTLCGRSKFFEYKRLLRDNLGLALKICYQLNLDGIFEHSGINYSKVYCVWPKLFLETNYCVVGSRLNTSLELSERIENFDGCSELEILRKLEEESPKRSMRMIFKTTGKEVQNILDNSIDKDRGRSLHELIRQFHFRKH